MKQLSRENTDLRGQKISTTSEIAQLPVGSVVMGKPDKYRAAPVLALQSPDKWYCAWDWESPVRTDEVIDSVGSVTVLFAPKR